MPCRPIGGLVTVTRPPVQRSMTSAFPPQTNRRHCVIATAVHRRVVVRLRSFTSIVQQPFVFVFWFRPDHRSRVVSTFANFKTPREPFRGSVNSLAFAIARRPFGRHDPLPPARPSFRFIFSSIRPGILKTLISSHPSPGSYLEYFCVRMQVVLIFDVFQLNHGSY